MKNEMLEKLEPDIKNVASMIDTAIRNRELIILRHHADCDGYCGALVLEEVILPIIQNQNLKAWQKYRRMPMRAPFYTYTDAVKDINISRFALASEKTPLLIIIDNGSGEEDLLALKRVKQHGIKVAVIDHHIFSEKVKASANAFLNSRTCMKDGSVTAGILSYEVASRLGEPRAIYPALSSVADKSSDEIIKHYSTLAAKPRDYLQELARCVDFEAQQTGHIESDAIYDFFNEKQERMMKLLSPMIDALFRDAKTTIEKFSKKKHFSGFSLYSLEVHKTTSIGDFVSAGKMTGIMHRMYEGPRVCLGFADDFVTIRAELEGFSVFRLMEFLKDKMPYGNISGGGHEFAGTIKFVPAVRAEVEKLIDSYLQSGF